MKLWDLYADGSWIGMSQGNTAYEAIRFAKRCLPNRSKWQQLSVKEWLHNPTGRDK